MHFKSPWGKDTFNEPLNNNSQNNRWNINFTPEFKKLRIIAVIILGIIGMWIINLGIYQVKEGERAAVIRFGEIVRVTSSGLNFALPFVEQVAIVPVDKSRRIEIGHRSEDRDPNKYQLESTMVTVDENIVNVTADVIFHIEDLEKYVMNVVDPEATIKSVVESSLREVTSRVSTQAVLSDGKQMIMEDTKQLAQSILDSYALGARIEMVQLLTAEPPNEVIEAYREVQVAKADKEKFINEAFAYRNKKLPEARGQSQQMILNAQGASAKRILEAEGQVARYKVALEKYSSISPDAKKALIMEMISDARGKILSESEEILINETTPWYNVQFGSNNKSSD